MYMEGNVPVVMGGNNGCNNGFGNGMEGLIGLALVAGLFDGGFNRNNGNCGNVGGYGVIGAVDATVQRGFDTSAILSKLDGINAGICDGFYAMNTGMLNGFTNIQGTLCQGFNGIQLGQTTQGYETRSAIADLGYRQQQCCCDLKAGLADIKYQMASDTCAMKQTVLDSTNRVIDYMTQKELANKDARIAALEGQLSQNAQTGTILTGVQTYLRNMFGCGNTCSNNCGCGYQF